MSAEANLTCDWLGIGVPRLEESAARAGTRLTDLAVLALLERGAAMSLEELAERIEGAGARRSGDLGRAILRSWGGRLPLRRDSAGKFHLDLFAWELIQALYRTRLLRYPRESAVEPHAPRDEVALSMPECSAALRRGTRRLSPARRAAAVLDAHGGALAFEEVQARLARATGRPCRLREEEVLGGRSLVRRDAEGRLVLDLARRGLVPMRRAVRRLAAPVLRAQRWGERFDAQMLRAREARERASRWWGNGPSGVPRAILRAVPRPQDPVAVAVLDGGTRLVRCFLRPEFPAAAEHLGRFLLLAGFGIRDTLLALGLDPERFVLLDLDLTPHDSVRWRRWEEPEPTAERLVGWTLRHPVALEDPERTARLIAEGAVPPARVRLEGDVRALYLFYRFGALHRCVLRHLDDEGDVHVPAEWGVPGEPDIDSLLRRALRTGIPVDAVLAPPRLGVDPSDASARYEVARVSDRLVVLRGAGGIHRVPPERILDVRLAGGSADG
ncbi:MAG: hypothetical protein L0323_07105 [Planctomycetes bacterium]|nr:hypothetical protein [Planctomycetota bacterium]